MSINEKLIGFLVENKKQNSTEWYRQHKDDLLNNVQRPLADLIDTSLEKLTVLDPYLDCDPRVGKGISRLYRDTRFSYDKTRFRDSIWFCIMREKSLFHSWPAFYFEVSPRGYIYGCGFYQEDRKTADSVRKLIIEDSPLWEKAHEAFEKQDRFDLYSEKYKKSLCPQLEEEKKEWIDRKSFGLISPLLPLTNMYTDTFYEEISDDYLSIFPIYKLMLEGALTAEKGD